MAKQTFTTGQVLTAAQMTSLQQTAMLGGAASAKTASYTLVAADAGTAISMDSASATTITVNTSLFAAGDTVQITNLGAGVCTITAGTATVNTSSSLALAQYESGTLDFISTSAAIFIKGAGAAAASGGMTLISETVLSGNSSLDFSSISGSYKQLLLFWDGIYHSASGSNFSIRFNNNSGSVYDERAFISQAGGVGFSDYTITGTSCLSGNANISPFGKDVSNQAQTYARGQMLIDNYASTTKEKRYNLTSNFQQTGIGMYSVYGLIGSFLSTSAITSINIVRLSGTSTMTNVTNTCVRLYGVS
jgi:hypothetical protein